MNQEFIEWLDMHERVLEESLEDMLDVGADSHIVSVKRGELSELRAIKSKYRELIRKENRH